MSNENLLRTELAILHKITIMAKMKYNADLFCVKCVPMCDLMLSLIDISRSRLDHTLACNLHKTGLNCISF